MKINYTDEQTEAMKRLYGQFVKHRDLVFNVGANIGTRTQVFVDLGVRVIAVEPQPEMAEALRDRFRHQKVLMSRDSQYEHHMQQVQVIEAAAGPENGIVNLHLCTDNQLATCEPGWAESLKDRWPMAKWRESIAVQQVTLDHLVRRYGLPEFIKIDVEGYENEVLRGLSYRVPVLCFEATIPFVGPALACLVQLYVRLGFTEFNYLVQERMALVLEEWVSAPRMMEILRGLPESTFYVDVFAR